jgi:hypothetical protein
MPATGSLEDVAAALELLGSAWLSSPPEARAALPPLMLKAAEVEPGHVEWVVRAELKPLLDLCVYPAGSASSQPTPDTHYSVRYSA